jgi:hypothetical protein
MRVGQLFRELRDESISNAVKVAQAADGWRDAALRFPKKSDFFVHWTSERLLKCKAQRGSATCLNGNAADGLARDDAPLLLPQFWVLLLDLLQTSQQDTLKLPWIS